MSPVHKQTLRPMEQSIRPKQISDIWQRCYKHTMEKKSVFSKWCWEMGCLNIEGNEIPIYYPGQKLTPSESKTSK